MVTSDSPRRDTSLDSCIDAAFSCLRDVSLRDGVQAWDGNKWKIDDILPVAQAINELIKEGKKRKIDMTPVEVWGGGQVRQPAQFLGEDPLRNLEAIKAAMPNADLQCLNRGRQCFAFDPVSYDVQEKAIEAAANRGIKVFRIFDMMNDPENLEDGFKALTDYQNKHLEKGIVIEGAVSYISPAENGTRAMTLQEYGEFAVKLAEMGANEIAIKNYAGVGDKEMPELITTIRGALDEAGFKGMKINLHDHGQKPDVLVKALEAGASKVDVAIGALSGGPSHSNMRDTLYAILKQQGVDIDNAATRRAVDNHPMMKKLAEVEKLIDHTVHKEHGNPPVSYASKRGMLEKITQEQVDNYHIASGAFSDPVGRIETRYKNGIPRGFPPKEEYFTMVLEKGRELWEKGGQFNTVTPGALIVLNQARELVDEEIYQQLRVDSFKEEYPKEYRAKVLTAAREAVGSYTNTLTDEVLATARKKVATELGKTGITLDKYNDAYVDVAIGRYGRNRGMEKGIGDTKWRDAMLMYRALKQLNAAAKSGLVTGGEITSILSSAQEEKKFGEGQLRLKIKAKDGSGQFDLRDPQLEQKLGNYSIEAFRNAVAKSHIAAELKQKLAFELSTDRSPTPAYGIEQGQQAIAALKERGLDVAQMHADGYRISSPEDMATLAVMLHGGDGDKVFNNVVETAQAQGVATQGRHAARARRSDISRTRGS